MVAEYFETLTVQLAHPALERNFPVRVRVKMAAHEAHADRVARFRRRKRRALTKLSPNVPPGQRPIESLQIPVVAALIGEIKRLAVRDGLAHACSQPSSLVIAA